MLKGRQFILILVGIIGFKVGNSQVEIRSYIADKKLVPREHSVDMLHMKLVIEFEPEKGLVKGRVTHTFVPLRQKVDSLFLDGVDITIKDAQLDDKKVEYETSHKGVTIYFDQPLKWGDKHSIVLNYEANPRKGLYFIGWNDPNNLSRKQIWTQGQGINNRHWIPLYDEKNDMLTTEMIVTFNSKYKVLSNGTKLKEKNNKDGTKTWHYKMSKPHAPYLVMLGIGEYNIKETKSSSGVPIYLWYYPEWEHRVEPTYKYSEKMMDFFESEIGVKYPWESYSQIPVQDFMYGAMENTTATLFGDFLFVDERGYLDRNYVAVNAHELAHQWFGDMVTARSSAHHWLQESFATHYNTIFEREVFGVDHFDWKKRQANVKALKASEKDLKPIAHSKAGVVRLYPKGAFVLNMIKYVVGKEPFNKAIKHYLENNSYKNVDSEDLLIAFHESLGISLDWFWEEWVYRGGEPHYKVSFQDITSEGEQFSEFSVNQVHEVNEVMGLFKMPVVFEVNYKDGTKDSKKVWIEDQHHSVKILNPQNKDIDFVLFDPNNEVMKDVSFKKPLEMLKDQALKAEHMLDRYDAVRAMRDIDIEKKRDVLLKAYNNEKFHAVKNEVIYQLLEDEEDEHEKSIDILKQAIMDKDVKVRKAVLKHLKIIPKGLLSDFEKLLRDPSYEIQRNALEKICFDNPSKTEEYLEITKNETGIKGKNVRIKWLEIAYNHSKDTLHIHELVKYVSNSYEFITRKNAAHALKRLNYFNKNLMKNLFNAITDPNQRLSGPCGAVLQYFYRQTAHKKTIYNYYKSKEWKDWEEEALEKFLE